MEKISNDRLLVEEFKRDFIIIIIIIIIIISACHGGGCVF